MKIFSTFEFAFSLHNRVSNSKALQNLRTAVSLKYLFSTKQLRSNKSRSSHQGYSIKKDVLENFAKFTVKHLFLGLGLQKETSRRVFSSKYCKIFKKNSIYRIPPAVVSVQTNAILFAPLENNRKPKRKMGHYPKMGKYPGPQLSNKQNFDIFVCIFTLIAVISTTACSLFRIFC